MAVPPLIPRHRGIKGKECFLSRDGAVPTGSMSAIAIFQQLAKGNVEASFRINYDALIRGPNDR
jgi:hypothetical protein